LIPGRIYTEDGDLREILKRCKSIAILGLSPKPERDSHKVAEFLQDKGYRVIPVRPGQKEILGERAYASLNEVDGPVDIVDVFRRSDQILPHAREALRLKPKVFWMQLGIENHEAAQMLTAEGIDVVMNRCLKIEYERLLG